MTATHAPSRPVSRFLDRSTDPHIATLVLISGLGAAAMNLFLPSLAAIAVYFEADYAIVQLAVSGFLALTGLLQLIIGPLADRFGRRPVLLGALTIFCVATLGCIFSTDVWTFLGFRMMQATVACGMVLSRAIVRDLVPGEQAASMIGYVTMGMALIPMTAPVLGGIMQDSFGWHSSFVALLIFGCLALLIVFFDLKETRHATGNSFADQIRQYPELFGSRIFWGYALSASFATGCFFALLGGGPWVAAEVLGMAPSKMGFAFGTIALGYFFGNALSGRITQRMGLFRMMTTGALSAIFGITLSISLYSIGFATPWAVFGPIFFVGLGNGMALPSANAGFLSIKPELAGTASGLGGAVMIGGGAALSATTGAVLGPGTGPYPMMLIMLGSALCCLMATLWTRRIAG